MRYDLQVHTDASPCSNATPRQMVEAGVAAGLDGIAITNHDTIAGIEAAKEVAPPGFHVVPGIEVTTTEGHLLGLFVGEPPSRSDPVTVVKEIHEQEGLAVLSHPFDRLRQYYSHGLETLAHSLDGVEVVNSRCLRESYNARSRSFASDHDLAMTGGSDAHFPHEVGRAYTVVNGSLDEAILSGATRAHGRGRYVTGHIATKLHQARTRLG